MNPRAVVLVWQEPRVRRGSSSDRCHMSHVVLLGDSIFDNARYVPDRPAVIEQVRRGLPPTWKATLVAVDGHTVEGVASQLPACRPPRRTWSSAPAGTTR